MRLAAALLLILATAAASAHEVRPAYLQLEATSSGTWEVLWKQPVLQDRRLPIDPVFPEDCELTPTGRPELTGGALLRPLPAADVDLLARGHRGAHDRIRPGQRNLQSARTS